MGNWMGSRTHHAVPHIALVPVGARGVVARLQARACKGGVARFGISRCADNEHISSYSSNSSCSSTQHTTCSAAHVHIQLAVDSRL